MLNFLKTGGTSLSESYEKVGYSILSTDLASPAPHRLHSVISDFKPPSGTESGEAALGRLPASRAVGGGYALTSDDVAPGSVTMIQSSRVARPLGASRAPNLVSLLSSSARFSLDTIRMSSVCFVLLLRLLGRYVHSVVQHSWRHHVGFICDLSQSGQGSREVPGPSVPGRVRSVPSRQMSS